MSSRSLNLVGFNDDFNTTKLYMRPCQGCVQTAIQSGNHKTESAILFRLLTQTKEALKKRNSTDIKRQAQLRAEADRLGRLSSIDI